MTVNRAAPATSAAPGSAQSVPDSGAVGLACAVTGLVFAGLWLTGTTDPVRMPVTPPWLTAAFAGAAAVLVLTSTGDVLHQARKRLALGIAAGVGMLAGSLFAVPHTVLLVVVWVGTRVTGGTGSFDIDPVWPAAAAHLWNVGSSALLGRWLLRRRRVQRDRCQSCGRIDATPPFFGGRHRLPWLAAIAIAACLPYGSLKLAWGLGARIGLTGHEFDDVSLTSPGIGDTVVLTLVSVATCLVMAAAVEHRMVRRAALAIGALGSAMLLPVGVIGAPMLALAALTGRGVDDTEIAAWVFGCVYLSFLTWGTALALLTYTYWRVTTPACSEPFHLASDAGVRDQRLEYK